MGWTWYNATHYKNGKIDRKAECDAYFLEDLNRGWYEVLKSAMVGKIYYAAVKALKKYDGNNTIDIPPEEQRVFGVIFITSIDSKSYYNFGYKDMDETCGPCYNDCPKGILDLLSPTTSQWANEWRQACYNNLKAKRNPNTLSNLPVGTVIKVKMPVETFYYKIGDEVRLQKCMNWKGTRSGWYSERARFAPSLVKLLEGHYEIIKKGE